MAFVMESVYKSEKRFLSLLKEGINNSFLNGVALNVYMNFLNEMQEYRREESMKNENLSASIFNQDVRYIYDSLSQVTRKYNENNPDYQISIFDINTILCGALHRPHLSLDKILGKDSEMLPKEVEHKNEMKLYKIPKVNTLELLTEQQTPLLKYA